MTYKKNFIAVIKHKGKILREDNRKVRLPFGSEYSILLKNLESVNAIADITVDGKDVLKGNSIIVGPNSSVELKGFMDRSITVRNRFRFIEKTDEIKNFRGDRPDDGIIRVEFRFEKKYEEPITNWIMYPGSPSPSEKYMKRATSDWTMTSSQTVGASNAYFSASCCSMPANEDGITVKGSQTKQDFAYGSVGTLEEQSHVIILRLKGTISRVIKKKDVISSRPKKVKKPVTVRTRLQCSSCGKRWKSSFKFCPSCSTFLE